MKIIFWNSGIWLEFGCLNYLVSIVTVTLIVYSIVVVTHSNGSRGDQVFTAVCLSVLPHDISKTDAARITKLDIQIFHDESWKPIYFLVKVTSHKNIAGVGRYTLVSAGFF